MLSSGSRCPTVSQGMLRCKMMIECAHHPMKSAQSPRTFLGLMNEDFAMGFTIHPGGQTPPSTVPIDMHWAIIDIYQAGRVYLIAV